MSHNLRGRLARLERSNKSDFVGLHPRFWDALCGAFPEDELDPETRKVFRGLFEDGQGMPDAIDGEIMPHHLAVHVLLAHPPCDELCCLPPEVHHQDGILGCRLLVRSDDPADAAAGGVRTIRLLPDPNAVECVDGATQACGTAGDSCSQGTRTCANGIYGACVPDDVTCTCGNGAVDAGEECDDGNHNNGDGCDATCHLEGAACSPDATWTLASPITYSCCSGAVGQDFASFLFSSNGTAARGDPGYGPLAIVGNDAQCPSGGFTFTATLSGGCDETYTLTGDFTDANTWTGTYTMSFTGDPAQCACTIGGFNFGSPPCTDQTFSVTATRP